MTGKRKAPSKPSSGTAATLTDEMEKSNQQNAASSAADDWAEIMAARPGPGSATPADSSTARATPATMASTTCTSMSAATAPPSSSSPSSLPSPTKKRPYRRTKRPVNYNDKSTITVSTPAAREAPNVYDAVLAEADDLMRAATEAQSLGRLKMASNYLLLLHTRLVGLGKKFDRSTIIRSNHMAETVNLKPTRLDMSMEEPADPQDAASQKKDHGSSKDKAADTQNLSTNSNTTDKNNNNDDETKAPPLSSTGTTAAAQKGPAETPPTTTSTARTAAASARMGISEAALNQLTNYLPSNIELDQAMVEHLARAAAELHQKRTGKRSTEEGLLNSPALNTEEVFHYNKDNNNSANINDNNNAAGGGLTPTTSSTTVSSKQLQWKKVAQQASEGWTPEEEAKLKAALRTTSDPARLAQLMGPTRTEIQIMDHLKRLDELEAMEKEMLLETPRKRGGRGRKPPTTAMNTVPNANYDAKALLGGTK